jgi:osmotically-inducible protein OsmY
MIVAPRICELHVSDVAADDQLRQRVSLHLLNAAHLYVRKLKVHARDGVVCLYGTVPTYYVRQLGVACAQQVDGVRVVVDEIDVERPIN